MNAAQIEALDEEGWRQFNVARDWLDAEKLDALVSFAFYKLNVRFSLNYETHADQTATLTSMIYTEIAPTLQHAHARHWAGKTGHERVAFLEGYARRVMMTRMARTLAQNAPLDVNMQCGDLAVEEEHLDEMFKISTARGIFTTEVESPEVNFVQQEEAEEHSRRLHEELESLRAYLKPTQYKFLRASVIDGETRQEMADKAGRPVSYVRSTLRRAAQALRNATGGEDQQMALLKSEPFLHEGAPSDATVSPG